MHQLIERQHDISQPLERLGADEILKARSDHLRGTISEGLLDQITGGIPNDDDVKLLKFHGIYQQDDRDLREERRRQKLEPAYQFMVRVRLPGGVCTPEQWLQIDELAHAHGGQTLRLTTRQTFQFHWVLKNRLKPLIQGLHAALLDTIAACGDDSRGVMSTANPASSPLHAQVAALAKQVSDHVIPKTRAYHEIWYGDARVASSAAEEPFYGDTYLPRKFKIGFAIPPHNDIDVFTQDLGFIAIGSSDGAEGFNVAIGGGMGQTASTKNTYPRLANTIGFVSPERVLDVAHAVMGLQRDYGNRVDRQRARFKYTIDDKGLEWTVAEIERRLGWALSAPRPYKFDSNSDVYGWQQTPDNLHHFTLWVENGRLSRRHLDSIRDIARLNRCTFRLTPNQNLVIADVKSADRATIDSLLDHYGLRNLQVSTVRQHAMACVALPTCGLAMAEAERYLPDLVTRIDVLLAETGLSEETISIRMTGCPNGCARPYVGEIGLTGRAPGKYNLYVGGDAKGERLNRLYRENIGESGILEALHHLFRQYSIGRQTGERFGDFCARTVPQ